MRLMDYGRVAATFVDTDTAEAIRIWPHPESRRFAEQAHPHEESNWKAQLIGYQSLPNDKLLGWQPVELTVSMQEIISKPGLRVICSRCGEEVLNEREEIVDEQPVCPACLGEAYYQQTTDKYELVSH